MFDQITLVGNLGRNPEMRYTQTGDAVTNLSAATNRTYQVVDGEQVKEAILFRVSVWRKQAEACNEYLHKDSKVLVILRLNTDPNTGGPRLWTRP